MRIDNEFGVDVPVERAWEALTDLEALAPCMPGAQLTGVEGDVHRGKVRIKVGPVISQFQGTARFVEKDEAAHTAVISATGKDTRGQGNASATVHARLRPEGARTVVSVSTDLNISGKLAQFGSGMIKEISEKLFAQFVANVEERLLAPAEPQTPAPEPVPTATTRARAAEASTAVRPSPAPETVTGPETQPVPAPETVTGPQTQPVPAPETVTGPETQPVPDSDSPSGAPSAAVPDSAPETASASASAQEGPVSASASASAQGRPVSASATPQVPAEEDSEPLDLMRLAGKSVYKRLIPVAVGAVVVGVVIYRLLR